MQNETVIIHLPEAGSMTDAQATDKALRRLGFVFTMKWVGDQQDKKLKGFCLDAESCRMKTQQFWNKVILAIGLILSSVIIAGFIYNSWEGFFKIGGGTMAGAIVIASQLFFTVMLVFCIIPDQYPGSTATRIARAWKQWRKLAIDTGVAEGMTERDELDDNWSVEFIKKAALRVVENRLRDECTKVTEAERDGFNSLRVKARVRFGKIHELGKALGLSVKDWGYYFKEE